MHGSASYKKKILLSTLNYAQPYKTTKNCIRVRHVAPRALGHIILIQSQPVFALSPYCCVLSGEAANTNFIGFSLTRPGLEPTIYRTHVLPEDRCFSDLALI
jgi:hypothetical protein